MTPAVIYCPGEFPKFIPEPTMHADLLPTLLAAVGLRLSDPESLDGIDLLTSPHQRLGRRLFVTRNYLSDDCALIGLSLGDTCFGYRCAISLDEWKAEPLNPINDAGYEQTSAVDGEAWLKQWTIDRFPHAQRTRSLDSQSRK
jgi:arylsulfatase A-like enzyme